MATARKCHASLVHEGRLWVMGGSDAQLSVLTAEWLDLTLPEDQWAWHGVASLPSWHNGSFGPAIGGLVYLPVAYGTDNDKIYDTQRDLWLAWEGRGQGEDGQRLARDRPGVGQLGERIYLVGGAGMREVVASVECWDGREWRTVARLNKAREGPGVVGYAGKLYAIGKTNQQLGRLYADQWETRTSHNRVIQVQSELVVTHNEILHYFRALSLNNSQKLHKMFRFVPNFLNLCQLF